MIECNKLPFITYDHLSFLQSNDVSLNILQLSLQVPYLFHPLHNLTSAFLLLRFYLLIFLMPYRFLDYPLLIVHLQVDYRHKAGRICDHLTIFSNHKLQYVHLLNTQLLHLIYYFLMHHILNQFALDAHYQI